MIYFGGRYTCSVAGSVWKEVRCEGCQCEYLYLLSRTGSGTGSSPYYIDNDGAQRRAEKAAVKNLQRRLERDCDAVACPDCGMYQPLMVRLLGRRLQTALAAAAITEGASNQLGFRLHRHRRRYRSKALAGSLGAWNRVVDVRSETLQSVEQIESLAAAGAVAVGPDRIALNPDCGFAPDAGEPPTIDKAFEKLRRLAEAAARLRTCDSLA